MAAVGTTIIADSLSGSKGNSFSTLEFVHLRNKGIEHIPTHSILGFTMKSSKEIGLSDFLFPITPFDKFIQKRKVGNNHGRGKIK